MMADKGAKTLEERLIHACSTGDVQEITECLTRGANMNKVCSNGRTALGVAAQLGNTELLKLFLNHIKGINITNKSITYTSQNDSSSNLGYFVVIHNETQHSTNQNNKLQLNGINIDDIHASLVESHPWMDVEFNPDEDILTPDDMDNLEWDAEIDEEGDILAIDHDPWASLYHWYAKILSQTAALLEETRLPNDIDGEDQFGNAALHYAAVEGHLDSILLLIRAGCKVNIEDSDNFSPLHLAASKERPEVIDLLLREGANPHHRSTDGITPLHVAASRGCLNNVKSLLNAGAFINTVDMSDRTPLYLAVSRRHHEVVQFMIERGAKVNLEEIHGYTPLYEAVCRKDVPLALTLLAAGAKVTQSHYLLHYAVLHRHEEMVRVLLEAGSIVNLRDESGDTPLMLAVKTDCWWIVKLLLQHGASPNFLNSVSRQSVVKYAICCLRRDCQQFSNMFSLFEDFGWDIAKEPDTLSMAIASNNDHALATIVKRWDVASDENLIERSEIMNLLLLRGNRFLVELFLFAGFNLRTFQPCDRAKPFSEWFNYYFKHPLSLRDIVRISIRRSLGKRIYHKLNYLNIPPIHKSYLRMDDLQCPCESGS